MSSSRTHSSFVTVVTSFVLGVFIAGLVVFAYAGFQKLLASYQKKLEESSHSLADLTTQTSEVLKQVNQALEENQQKIQELELLKEKFAKGDSPKGDSPKAPEPKPEPETPKAVSVKKQAVPVVRPPVTAGKGPLDEEIEHLTSQGIPEDYGRRSRLIELYKKKAEGSPSDAHSLMMVGRLSQQLGDFSQATRYLERALDKGANSREVTARLAQIYSEWKMPDKAEYYRQKLSSSDN
ncbi:MAG: tetratricopeptide repeat protein [Deltaproteobacteria bacterium]|nr:tetratricopeptide repeat protein [Deltaproteobacteria bacterium]